MKIEVNIDKRYFIILMAFIGILGIVLVTNAYGEGNPEVIGHSWNDIGGKPEGFADGVDNVDDADSDPNNEIQNLNQVLSEGNNAGGQGITNIGAPSDANDAATKNYVDISNNNYYCYTYYSTSKTSCNCPSGETKKKDLGLWGYCSDVDDWDGIFKPAGISCDEVWPGTDYYTFNRALACVCCGS